MSLTLFSVDISADLLHHIVLFCASPMANEVLLPSHPPLAPTCLWGAADAALTLTSIASTCKALQAVITDDAWAAVTALPLPSYASAKVSASHWAMVKRKMLHALQHRPDAAAVHDVDGVFGVWALLDKSDESRAPWMATKKAIADFQAWLVVDLPKEHAKKKYALTDGDLANLVPRLRPRYTTQHITNAPLVAYGLTDVLRVARRKHLGEGVVKLTASRLREACGAVNIESAGTVPQLKLRLHQVIDPFSSPSTLAEQQVHMEIAPSDHYPWTIDKTSALTTRTSQTSITDADLTFLSPCESRNRHHKYAARILWYQPADLRRICARKHTSGAKIIGKRALRALCTALGVPTCTTGNGAKLVNGKWCGETTITKRQMLIRARLAIDPNGRITRRRNASDAASDGPPSAPPSPPGSPQEIPSLQPPISPVALEMQRQQVEAPSPPEAACITLWVAPAFACFPSQGCFSGLVARHGLLDYALSKFADLCGVGEPNVTGDARIEKVTREWVLQAGTARRHLRRRARRPSRRDLALLTVCRRSSTTAARRRRPRPSTTAAWASC